MDGFALAGIGILVKNGDDRPLLCGNDAPTGDNGYIDDLMVVNTGDV